MKENITRFLVSFSGQIEYVRFPAGVFDDQIYLHYDIIWGPDWNPISGLSTGTSQMASAGSDPERVVFNLPIEMVYGSTNVFGCKLILVIYLHYVISKFSLLVAFTYLFLIV